MGVFKQTGVLYWLQTDRKLARLPLPAFIFDGSPSTFGEMNEEDFIGYAVGR